MAIKVKFFGSVREQIGQSHCSVDSEGLENVADVWSRATEGTEVNPNIYCAVNLEHREMNYSITDGDEVAFFPPVTGG